MTSLDRLEVEIEKIEAVAVERDRRYTERFVAQEQAILKAEQAQKSYNDTHNDLIRRTIPRQEHESQISTIDAGLKELRDLHSTYFTRTEHEEFLRRVEEDIRILRESKALLEGKASQASVNITLVVSAAGLILTVLNIVRIII